MENQVLLGDCAETLKRYPDETFEEWRDIEGYEGLYQISNMGQIKSFKRLASGEKLKLIHYENDYPNIVLRDWNKRGKKFKVHRIVAKTFIPNPFNYSVINHKNGIKSDNRVANLEWCTYQQNVVHSFKVLKHEVAKGESAGNTKLTKVQVKQIYDLSNNSVATLKDLSKMFNISIGTVSDIKKGRSWKHVTQQEYTKKKHTNSKLTEEQVKEIYSLVWLEKKYLKDIAEQFNVSIMVVSNIKNRVHFKSVTEGL